MEVVQKEGGIHREMQRLEFVAERVASLVSDVSSKLECVTIDDSPKAATDGPDAPPGPPISGLARSIRNAVDSIDSSLDSLQCILGQCDL